MRTRSRVLLIAAALGVGGVVWAQRPFKQYRAAEYENFPLPPDWGQKTEWTRARLKYPSVYAHYYRGDSDLNWTIDYPRSDRHLLEGVRRLTRIDTRSVEQVVDLDGTDEVYNWPMMYAVEVGHWALPDDQAAQLRDFLLRGGFLMVDDFHGDEPYHRVFSEWQVFVDSMTKVFPDRPIVDLQDSDPIFHTIYDLDDRFQVAGWQWTYSHRTYEAGETGKTPHWRAIFDDKGRVMVAICHNMDLGDAWEWSDDARYPEKWAALAYQIAMNYFIYDLTH
ncbi:MAG TPA: DUF4159 domain-containing protein [Bryobacteraceae bacterium]|nr:DUF4159 domain-containing protein [Bryobacteraceae bacterium]